MADPLSIAASVAGLITLGTSIAQGGYSYLSAARAAPKEIIQLLNQTSALNIVLSQLLPISMNQASSPKRHALVALNQRGTLEECQAALNSISSLLSEYQQVEGQTKTNIAKSLKWPFYQGKAERLVSRLDRLQNLLHLAIAVDSDFTLQRLEQQLEGLQLDQQDGFHNLLHLNQNALEHLKVTQGDVQSIKHAVRDSNNKNVLTWLSVLDPWPKHRATRALHQPGTGTWVFDEPSFIDWLKDGYCLWVNGGNGFGKTVLASTIIERLQSTLSSPRQVVTCHYCDFRTASSLNSTNMLGSIVRQVIARSAHLPSVVQNVYDALVHVRPPGIDDFQDLLIKMSGISFEMIYIIVDGLDECPDRTSFLQVISNLNELSIKQYLRIIVTSRPSQDIRQSFEKMGGSIFSVGPHQIAKDVELHVETELFRQPKLSKLPRDIKALTLVTITGGAQGMFRWVGCQLDVLSKARSTAAVRRALNELPTGLDETYDRIFSQVQDDDRPLVRRALQWILACLRPMTLLELAEAVTIDPEVNAFDPDERLIDPKELLDMCGSLVQLNSEDQVVSLAHYSVKEYLLSPRLTLKEPKVSYYAVTQPECTSFVANSLLVYIFHLGNQAYGPRSPVHMAESMASNYPLYDYARYLWRGHCSYSNFGSGQAWFRKFFTATLDPQPTSWIVALNEKMALGNLRFINPSPSRFIRNAAEFLLLSFIEEELRKSKEVVQKEDSTDSTVLNQAITMLGLSPTPTLQTDVLLWTHLTAASQCGFGELVAYLLGRGFSRDSESRHFNHFYSPLSLAAKVGYKGIVRRLMESKWNQKLFHDDHGMALILAAARRGARGKEIVEYLLDLGIDTNAPDVYGFTIHHWARHDTSIRRTVEPIFDRLDKLRSNDPDYQDVEVLRLNILQLIRTIKETDSLVHATECGWLSVCLRYEGLDEEAAIFAEQRIIPGDPIEHWWTGCDMHNAALERSLVGTRYRCLDCFDTDLCSECHRTWESNEALDFCRGHQYVAIPREIWHQLRPEKVNQKGESIAEVLDRLEARFMTAPSA